MKAPIILSKYFGEKYHRVLRDSSDVTQGQANLIAIVPKGVDNKKAQELVESYNDLIEAAKASLKLIDDMSRFVGSMALRDYENFNGAPMKL